MKRKLIAASAALTVLCGGVALGAQASGALEPVKAYLNNAIKLSVNGSAWQAKDDKGNALAPITYEDNTYVPLRALGEALHLKVDWDPKSDTAAIAGNSEAASGLNGLKLVHSYSQDVTGDGQAEAISLWGHVEAALSAPLYDSVLVTVKDGESGQTQMLSVNDAVFDPALSFVDLNGDGTADLFFTAPTPSNGGFTSTHLFVHQSGGYAEIPLPAAHVTAQLEDNYKVKITDTTLNQSFTVDIADKKQEYDSRGVYKDGAVAADTDLMVEDVAMYKAVEQADGSVALQGYMGVDGLYHADGIADVTLTWKWQDQGWELQKVAVDKTGQ